MTAARRTASRPKAKPEAPRVAPAVRLADPPPPSSTQPWKPTPRQLGAGREVLVQQDGSVVERVRERSEHTYSLWCEVLSGHRYSVTRPGKDGKVYGRADTRHIGDIDDLLAAIDLDLQHRLRVEDRIIAACPELLDVGQQVARLPEDASDFARRFAAERAELKLGGRVYRSRGQVRISGPLEDRHAAVLRARELAKNWRPA